uniref:Putative secreted peptide n=1 Tax=Anopheles braziliensis TaxID=58242 RepID=A0A2M3ZVZ2_9DIPT
MMIFMMMMIEVLAFLARRGGSVCIFASKVPHHSRSTSWRTVCLSTSSLQVITWIDHHRQHTRDHFAGQTPARCCLTGYRGF